MRFIVRSIHRVV